MADGTGRTIKIASAAAAATLVAVTLAGVPAPAADSPPDPATRYDTVFESIDAGRAQNLAIENRAVALINATPSGERIRFAFRDFNRPPVVNALLAAKARSVDVRGVVDGGERNRPVLQPLKQALGANLVFCGSDLTPPFRLNSCLANDPSYSEDGKSLQHNKFMTFSRLDDGRENVVLETSMNFFGPSQLTYFNDAVEISGDAKLEDAYDAWVADMMVQDGLRTNDRYTGHRAESTDGRVMMLPSPRWQENLREDDTIAEQLDRYDCTGGGSIVAANQAFRSERAIIADTLAAREREGCQVSVVYSLADADIVAALAAAGIDAVPLFWNAQTGPASLPHVRVHSKLWLVDAKLRETGARTRVVYAGSSNWRGDEQYSDDLLLRVQEPSVYDAYRAFWQQIRENATSDMALLVQGSTVADTTAPASAVAPVPGTDGTWSSKDVPLRIAGSDGHLPNATSGLARLHVELSGAQTGTLDVMPSDPRLPAVATPTITAEGVTHVTYHAVDLAGNAEATRSFDVRIDRTPPVVQATGRLAGPCELWPPNGELTAVGGLSASDTPSGLAGPIAATVTGAADPADFRLDVSGTDSSVWLRAVKGERAEPTTYTVRGSAVDLAGNVGAAVATCTVPHSQGASG